MSSPRPSTQSFFPALLSLTSLLLQPSCGEQPPGLAAQSLLFSPVPTNPQPAAPDVTCPSAGIPSPFPAQDLPAPYTAKAGTIPGAFSVTPTGEATYSLPLATPPGRAGIEPHLSVTYNSASGDGPMGVGFALTGLSAVTRCPSNIAQDARIREVRLDDEDNYCLDGKRLVPIAVGPGATVEYRTFPDSFARVVGHFAKASPPRDPRGFTVHMPSGLRAQYGTTDDSRTWGVGGVVRAWLVSMTVDPRNNFMTYAYRNDRDPGDQHTVEHLPLEIRYTGFDGATQAAPERAVRFHYDDKTLSAVRTMYTRGMAVKASQRLARIEMVGPGSAVVRNYHFGYDLGPVTGRTRLVSAVECAASGVCKPPTRFAYTGGAAGFTKLDTGIARPFSANASPMMLDLDGDGRDDLVIPDLTDLTSHDDTAFIAADGIVRTSWNVAKTNGGSLSSIFAAPLANPKVSAAHSFEIPTHTDEIQPELGTAIDYNQDGRMDILVHDYYGTWKHWSLLISQPDGSLDWHNTNIERPLLPGTKMPGLRTQNGAAHLADVNGDGVPDLVQCKNANPTGMGSNDYQWSIHLWTPAGPGFEQAATAIDPLFQYPCNAELHTVDVNADGKVDLMVKDADSIDGQLVVYTSYVALSREEDGSWTSLTTGLPTFPYARLMLLDVNGDGLVDAVQPNQNHKLYTYLNTGNGFASAVESLPPQGASPVDAYFGLASSLDYDGDGLRDLLVPMPAGVVPGGSLAKPTWAILRATGSVTGPTFTILDAKIPFEPFLDTNAVTLADPHGPRIADVDGDGAPDVVIALGGSYKWFHNDGGDQDLLSAVTDGMNAHDPGDPAFVANVRIGYRHLTDQAITGKLPPGSPAREELGYVSRFDGLNGCAYPRHCVVGPRRAVAWYGLNNGADKLRAFALKYRDGRYHRLGRGFLGFGSRLTVDVDTGATREEVFDNRTYDSTLKVYLKAGHVVHEKRWTPPLPGQPAPRMELSFVDVDLATVKTYGGQTYFTMPMKRRIRQKQATYHPSAGETAEALARFVEAADDWALPPITDSTTLVTNYDTFGNVLAEETTTGGVDLSLSTTRTYDNDQGAWRIGRLTHERQCSSAGGVAQCRITDRAYGGFGQITNETRSTEDNNPETRLEASFLYDAFGNLVHTKAKDGLGNERASCVSYEPEGIFPFAHKNAAGHLTYTKFHPGLGVLLASVDPNKLTTRWAYDGFGRAVEERRPDGTATTMNLERFKLGGAWTVSLHTLSTGGGDETIEHDSLGRPIRRFAHGPEPLCTTLSCAASSPPRIMERIEYDELGEHVARRSLPAAETTPAGALAYERWEYDAMGRMVLHTSAWGAETRVSYIGAAVQVVEPGKPPTTTHRDALGRVKSVFDAAGGFTSYSYGPFGHARTVTAVDATVTTMEADAWGRTTSLTDPNRGKSISHYNGFGDLTSSVDVLGRKVRLFYDFVGRKVARFDDDGATVTKTKWVWDIAPLGAGPAKALGGLAAVESPDAQTSLAYDALGRVASSTLTVNGELFSTKLGYDAAGRVSTIDYPEPGGAEPFAIVQEYDAYGHLIRVREPARNLDHWTLTGTDGAGRVYQERFGNGVGTSWTYDDPRDRVSRILTMRGTAKIQDLSYTYDDSLNLTSRRDALQAQQKTERFRYDSLDRVRCAYFAEIESASAPCATSYAYNAIGNLTSKSDVGAFTYGDPAHPHAVTMAGGQYEYDAVGNQVHRPGATLTYTAFDLPRTVELRAKTVWFGYDGDERRIQKKVTSAAGNTETIYVGDLYERVTGLNGEAEHKYYVHAAGRVVAIVTRSADAASSTVYTHPDNLGSTDVLTRYETGGIYQTVVERRSYDAFGARRNPSWGDTSPAPAPKTSKGYTGHEADDDLGLVNMKGRMYDPRLGRFLMPDPLVSRPMDGQGWNRYSYVRNNPLKYVDPSGFEDLTPAQARLAASPGGGAIIDASGVKELVAPEVTVVGPKRENEDISQALAAGAAHAPNDTSTLGSGSGHVSTPVAPIPDCTAAGQSGCYPSQDGASWFLEHGKKFQYGAAGVAAIAGIIVAWQALPIVVEIGAAEGAAGAAARGALWSRAGPTIAAVAAASLTPPGQQLARTPGQVAASLANATRTAVPAAQDAAKVLQGLTDAMVAQLIQNPGLATTVLSKPQQMLAANPKLTQAMFGKAVELLVADNVKNQYSQILLHIGNRAGPDFAGVGPAAGRIFDITTFFGQLSHFARPYGAQLELILYEVPKAWP